MFVSTDVKGLTGNGTKNSVIKLKTVIFKMLVTSDNAGTTISLNNNGSTIAFNMPDSVVKAIYKERFKEELK